MKRVLLMTVAGLLVASSAMADMSNCRFALHWKAKFSATKTITTLCDAPGTITVEPNYSPNWNSATTTSNPLPCTSYTVTGPVGAGVVYLVIGRAGGEGVLGASFGINYSGGTGTGIDPRFVLWTACADGLQFPNNDGVHGDFPQPGGGLRITWNGVGSCQNQVIAPAGVHCVVGSFYIYAYGADQLKVTPNNNLQGGLPELALVDCGGVQTDLAQIWPPAIYNQELGICGIGGSSGYNPCLVTATHETTWGKIKNQYNH